MTGRAGKQVFGILGPSSHAKSCRVFASLHRQKKRKATIIYLRCFARGRKRDYYILAPRLYTNGVRFVKHFCSLAIFSHLFHLPSWAEHRQNRP